MRFISISSALLGSALALGLAACQASSVRAETPASVAEAKASAALTARAEQLVAFINGKAAPADLFAPEALAKVPAERWTSLAAMVRERRGEALGVSRIETTDPNTGKVFIDFPESQFSVKIRVQSSAPHLIDGLMIE